MKIKDLPKGTYFTLTATPFPKESQVYIRGEYDRSERKYECTKFSDIGSSRLFRGDKEVYVNFIF